MSRNLQISINYLVNLMSPIVTKNHSTTMFFQKAYDLDIIFFFTYENRETFADNLFIKYRNYINDNSIKR